MRAFSTVGDVFADPEFSAPGNSLLWGLGALEDSNRGCAGFLIMPKRPYERYVDAHGCCKFNNADLALAPRDSTAHFPVFLHIRTTNFPSITRSEQAQQKRLERQATKHERQQCRRKLTQPSNFLTCYYRLCGNTLGAVFVTWPLPLTNLTARSCACFQYRVDEADESDVAQKDHMNAYHLTPTAVISES